MADGVIFEKLGVPAVSIVTHTFTASGDAMAKRQGIPGYRYAKTQHPTVNLTPEECDERVQQLYTEVLAILGLEDRPPLQKVGADPRAASSRAPWPLDNVALRRPRGSR